MKTDIKIKKIRHSLAHILAHAIQELYPGTKFGMGPDIENGFYYDFDLPEKLTIEDLPKIEKKMKDLIKQNIKFEKEIISKQKAKELFKNEKYKLELIQELPEKSVSIYKIGKFIDLCKGPHVKSSKEIPIQGFKLSKVAGAYWKGDEKNNMLTRIYGVAFKTKKDLEEYLKQQEEAEKRDHRKIGAEMDLFTFSDLVGPGLPLWTPKGTLLRNLLEEKIWSLRKKQGYVKVEIPHITKKDLYIKSGHWDKFKDELFTIKTRENHFFALKPMNCPHHIQIFARKLHSYKEMPQRYSNVTMQYRDEQTGELIGLSRVRSISIDDAHIFARYSDIEKEILNTWKIIEDFYNSFGFKLRITLSLHDPEKPEKYLGEPKIWKQMETILRKIAKNKKIEKSEVIGEAAFYGPKIDFLAKDSIGREWQLSTIQLDMNLPERFNLSCINEKGEKERIIMIHSATMGSMERFLSIIIEHYAGNFPLWLAPEQIWIIPISLKHEKYAQKIKEELEEESFRVILKNENDTLSKKIREGEIQKIPYLLIVGDKEVKLKSVNPRTKNKNLEMMKFSKFLERIKKEIK